MRMASVSSEASGEQRLHTLDPNTGAILTTVVVTVDPPPATGNVPGLTALGVDASGVLLASVSFSGLNNVSDLGRLDPATGVLTRLGPTGFRTLFGVQFDPAFRTLYAITGAADSAESWCRSIPPRGRARPSPGPTCAPRPSRWR